MSDWHWYHAVLRWLDDQSRRRMKTKRANGRFKQSVRFPKTKNECRILYSSLSQIVMLFRCSIPSWSHSKLENIHAPTGASGVWNHEVGSHRHIGNCDRKTGNSISWQGMILSCDHCSGNDNTRKILDPIITDNTIKDTPRTWTRYTPSYIPPSSSNNKPFTSSTLSSSWSRRCIESVGLVWGTIIAMGSLEYRTFDLSASISSWLSDSRLWSGAPAFPMILELKRKERDGTDRNVSSGSG